MPEHTTKHGLIVRTSAVAEVLVTAPIKRGDVKAHIAWLV